MSSELFSWIARAYGSLEEPRFDFVRRATEERPYREIIHSLTDDGLEVADDTDTNDDVAFSYLLTAEGHQHLLQISMLGPFALLLRIGQDGCVELVQSNVTSLTSCEELIVNRLQQYNVKLLSDTELSLPVHMELPNTAASDVRVYQAVFSDRDTLPWNKNAQ